MKNRGSQRKRVKVRRGKRQTMLASTNARSAAKPLIPCPPGPLGGEILVDPEVSKIKFQKEVESFLALEKEYLKRGWILYSSTFPNVIVLLASPTLKPSPLLFGVRINFENYDILPPSVTFIDPLTQAPVLIDQLPSQLPVVGEVEEVAPGQLNVKIKSLLIQAHADKKPFLCVPGIREYHSHPAHSNDPWLRHRTSGAGRLYTILDIIYQCGILHVVWNISLVHQVKVPPK